MTIDEIAAFTNGRLVGSGDTDIFRVAGFAAARENEISFVETAEIVEQTPAIHAACVLVPENFDAQIPCSYIKVANPKLAFAKVAGKLYPFDRRINSIHETAVIASDVTKFRACFVGAFVTIGENCAAGEGAQILDGARIGNNVSIGKNSIVHPNCVIYGNVEIGSNCVIHAGAVIGADGFGYVRDGGRGYVKFPQIGTVVIEDNVEIGANACVDRGALGETRIGEGTKIDNQVQIAHNVRIGKRVVIAAQTGISGSTVIEDDSVIGGQVGMGDHATIKSGAIIGSQAGVLPGKIVRPGVWWGTPVQPLDEYKRQNAHVKGIARLKEEVKRLKELLTSMKKENE